MKGMEEPSERHGFWIRNFVRPLLTEARLGWRVPGRYGENVLMALARSGRLSWVAPEALTDEMLNKRQSPFDQSALGASLSLHPDKTPARWMTPHNLLEPGEEVGRNRLGDAYNYKSLDKLEIRPEFAPVAGDMRAQISRLVAYHESELARDGEDRMERPTSFDPVEADNHYRERIAGGKRWLAKLDQAFPPPVAAEEKKAPVAAVATVPAKDIRRERSDLPEVPHLPKVNMSTGASTGYGLTEGR